MFVIDYVSVFCIMCVVLVIIVGSPNTVVMSNLDLCFHDIKHKIVEVKLLQLFFYYLGCVNSQAAHQNISEPCFLTLFSLIL